VIDPQNDFCDLPAAWQPIDPVTGLRTASSLAVAGTRAGLPRTAVLDFQCRQSFQHFEHGVRRDGPQVGEQEIAPRRLQPLDLGAQDGTDLDDVFKPTAEGRLIESGHDGRRLRQRARRDAVAGTA